MNRFRSRFAQFTIDSFCLGSAFALAVWLRFDGVIPQEFRARLFTVLPYVVLLQIACLTAFGTTRFSWRYIALRDMTRFVEALGVATAALLAIRLAVPLVPRVRVSFGATVLPIGVVVIDYLLAFLFVVGVRILRRLIGERLLSQSRAGATRGRSFVRTLLIGASDGGALVAQEIGRRPDLDIRAVGILDDDALLVGTELHGIRVLGTTDRIVEIATRTEAEQALISMPYASGARIRALSERCREAGLRVKIVPGMDELVDGQVNLSRIREVQIEDLLRREQVVLNDEVAASVVRDNVVLVTGAGGSIGAELARQVWGYRPRKLLLVDRAEGALFLVDRELREAHDAGRVARGLFACVADVCDGPRIGQLLRDHGVQVVFHAAAHKHVPMMERNPLEAIKNNVLGTRELVLQSVANHVQRFVLISTDKAVNPRSLMGASKRAAEVYMQAVAGSSSTRFSTVRFGNVLGSTGSVVPIFTEQIRRGGPITVTHEAMTRYFMTIPEAVQLVMHASALANGGEVFVLDMGEPVRIVDLAHDLIRLSGLEPERDVQVIVTGIRPGEKIHEELSIDPMSVDASSHPKIFVGRDQQRTAIDPQGTVQSMADACRAEDERSALELLKQLVPEYTPFRMEAE